MDRTRKKAADLGGDQQPQEDRLRIHTIAPIGEDVKRFEHLLSLELNRRDCAAGNWQCGHYA